MATTTRATLRATLGKATGFYYSSTTTSGGTTTTLVDSSIVRFDTSLLPNKWVLITSGNNDGEARQISSVSSSTITVVSAFSNSVASSVTYEILPYDPELYHNALEQAARTVYPFLWVPLRDETIIVDNLLSNSDFETFSGGAFTNWSSKGSPSVSQSTSRGGGAASITASGATEGIEQDIYTSVNIPEAVGKTIHVRAHVFCDTASAARIRVTFDGSNFDNGPFHGGDAEWEPPSVQKIDATIDEDSTETTVSCEVTDGNNALFDLVVAWIDPITRYTLPTSFISGPHKVFQQVDINRPDGDYQPLGPGNPPKSGHILRLEGMGRLTVPTSDTGTVELDEARSELLIAEAASHLSRTLRNLDFGNAAGHLRDEDRWKVEAARLRNTPGIFMPPMSAHRRDLWGVTADSDGRYLVLPFWRA